MKKNTSQLDASIAALTEEERRKGDGEGEKVLMRRKVPG